MSASRWLALLVLLALADAARADDSPVVLRELYVPYEEFQRLTAERSDGVVMELAEYRELVERALREQELQRSRVLPPVAATIRNAVYRAEVAGATARITVELQVYVHGDGWVQCDLGAPMPALARVRVDDAPGWVVHDGDAATEPRARLLLAGRGEHRVELVFSLPVTEGEDRRHLAGPLVPSSSAVLELVLPGRVRATSTPAALASEHDPESATTLLRLALGSAERFQIDWRADDWQGDQRSLITADHRWHVYLEPTAPVFAWHARIEIHRRKTDVLRLRVPPGATVVKLEGELVHSWERDDPGLRVLLKEPRLGIVDLTLSGPFTMAGDSFDIAPPGVESAFIDRGAIELSTPRGTRPELTVTDDWVELDVALPVRRRFAFSSPGSRLRGRVTAIPAALEQRGSFLARVGEGELTLDGFLHITARGPARHRLALEIPPEWRVVSLQEDAGDAVPRGLRVEPSDSARVRLELDRAIGHGAPLRVRLRLEHVRYQGGGDWSQQQVQFRLPVIVGATDVRSDLGISLYSSIHLGATQLEGWRSLTAGEGDLLGLEAREREEEAHDARLLVAVTSETLRPHVSLDLLRREVRGEYRAVTHLLAAERAYGAARERHLLRVRADLRLVVVDRPVDRLTIQFPVLAARTPLHVLGEGIRDVDARPEEGVCTARFTRPWVGTRHLRLEYEVPVLPGTESAFPDIRLAGAFTGERFLVVQSQGSVEIEARPGEGLATIDPGDLPDFAEPWPDGRTVEAYRYRIRGAVGTVTTTVHERAPVIGQLARLLELTTVIGEDGTARTWVRIELVESREQALRVELPPGVRCLGVRVGDRPVHAVRVEPATRVVGGQRLVVPLPPRAFTEVSIIYERAADSGELLDREGHWRARGPVLVDLPVVRTRWQILYPSNAVWFVEGGNLRTVGRAGSAPVPFMRSFFGRLLGGRWPRLTVFAPAPTGGPLTVPAAFAPIPETHPAAEARAAGRLAERSRAERAPLPVGTGAPPILRGRRLELEKLGGAPIVELYRVRKDWWSLARHTVLGATLLSLLLVVARGRGALAWRLGAWGLLFGTLLPVVLATPSPLLAVPFCEGLVCGMLLLGVVTVLHRVGRRLRSWRASALLISLGALAVGLSPGAARAEEDEPPRHEPALGRIFDEVLIPYAGLPGATTIEGLKVFVSEARFRELTRWANPESAVAETAALADGSAALADGSAALADGSAALADGPDHVLANGDYQLTVSGEEFQVSGSLELRVLTEGWVQVPLRSRGLRLERVAVDGQPTGLAEIDGRPALVMRGVGRHRIELEFIGRVDERLGEHHLRCQLPAAPGARVRGWLPDGAEILPAHSSRLVIVEASEDGRRQRMELALGSGGLLELSWSYPGVEADLAAGLGSTSTTLLRLDATGYAILRHEMLRAAGAGVERVRYRIHGGGEITAVEGNGISGWRLVQVAGEPTLEVEFADPVTTTAFRILGQARLADSAELTTLELIGSVRQEGFVSLVHGGGRRFLPESLAGLRRVSAAEHERGTGITLDPLPDRIYHGHGSGAGEELRAARIPDVLRFESDGVALVDEHRIRFVVRHRYRHVEGGPLRHAVRVPTGWRVRSVESEELADWWIETRGDERWLVVDLDGRIATGQEVLWSADIPRDASSPDVLLPRLRVLPEPLAPGSRSDEDARWRVIADPVLEVRVRDAGDWQPLPLEGLDSWFTPPGLSEVHLAYETRRGREPLRLTVRRRSGSVSATVVAFARLADDHVQVNARCAFRMRGAERSGFGLRLPRGATLVDLDARNLRARTVRRVDGRVEVKVELESPVRGEVFIDLILRLPRGDETRIEPLVLSAGDAPVTEVDHFVGVVQTARTFTLETTSEGLVAVEREQVPFLPAAVSARSLQPTFRATSTTWSLTLREQEIEVLQRLAARIPLAELTTRIGLDGTVRTQVVYTVLNESLQFLALELPPGASLWGVTVNGRPVSVGLEPAATGRSGRVLQVPVEQTGRSSLPLEVILTYEESSIELGVGAATVARRGPRIVDTARVGSGETTWTLHFPKSLELVEHAHRMHQVPPSRRHAERLEQLLEQKTRVLDAARGLDSKRSQERAGRELARIEQALGDSIAQLKETHRSSAEQAQRDLLGEGELEQQWRRNELILERAGREQRDLQARLRSGAVGDSGPGRSAQELEDGARFQRGHSWRGGQQARTGKGGGARTRPPRGLGEEYRDRGWQPFASIPTPPVAERALPAPIDAAGGLAPLPDRGRLGGVSALRLDAGVEQLSTFSFWRAGGEAELELSVRRRGLGSRIGALLALLLLPLARVLWRFRRRSAKTS